jgi:Xaa-Pro aminopeptidase
MISEKEYKKRRLTLAKKLKSNSVAIIFSSEMKTRSNDTEYEYRQDSNFYYLTGFKEDNSALVIVKRDKKFKTYLFVQKKDKLLELWTGKRLGQKRAKEIFDVNDVFTMEEYDSKVKMFLKDSRNLYFDFKADEKKIKQLIDFGSALVSHRNISILIGAMRLIKSDSEINLIKKAISITKDAHHIAMQKSKNLNFEYELQAEIEYVFKKNGAYSDAYTSIVACGNSANTLHYISNDKPLKDGELILIDAGCEYDYYSSDITRTIPVNGKFNEAQKELYEMVLDVEKEIIGMIKPNVLRSDLQKKSEELLCMGMVKLGILQGSVKKLLKKKAHKKYYPHGIGHWMGLDVHDDCPYKTKKSKEIPLKAGMILTIEPGIYLDKNDKNIPKKYRGIGIRIEDDILVTKDGCENLSKDIKKEIEDIEKLSSYKYN